MLGGIPTTLLRGAFAWAHLRGRGLEIGALHRPMPVPPWAAVRYVDRCSTSDLEVRHTELGGRTLVAVDIVDDGERLATVADQSQDFVIASHFLEHCQDPLGALESFGRVLRPGGVVYLVVPLMHRTFDRPRAVTTLSHLVRDHGEGPSTSRLDHYLEWARLVEGVQGVDAVQRRAAELMREQVDIHFHVFTAGSLRELAGALPSILPGPLHLVRGIALRSEWLGLLRRS